MKAAILSTVRGTAGVFLRFEEVPRPLLEAGHVLLRVVACGVCRTDLHIVEGDLPQVKQQLIPGHQIVGEVIEGATAELPLGARVGVSWMGGVDGDCWYCRHGLENLCDRPAFTGYILCEQDFARVIPPKGD
jgi:propanol-preferring alcohol dehydrogenase